MNYGGLKEYCPFHSCPNMVIIEETGLPTIKFANMFDKKEKNNGENKKSEVDYGIYN